MAIRKSLPPEPSPDQKTFKLFTDTPPKPDSLFKTSGRADSI